MSHLQLASRSFTDRAARVRANRMLPLQQVVIRLSFLFGLTPTPSIVLQEMSGNVIPIPERRSPVSRIEETLQVKCLRGNQLAPSRHTYSQTSIQPDIHTVRHLYSQTSIQPDIRTVRPSYSQTFVQPDIYTARHSYSQTSIQPDIYTARHSYSQTSIQPAIRTARHSYSQTSI